MAELILVVEDAPEGGYAAEALGESIFTQSEDIESLHGNIRDAVSCHFGEGKGPSILGLHFVKEEVPAV